METSTIDKLIEQLRAETANGRELAKLLDEQCDEVMIKSAALCNLLNLLGQAQYPDNLNRVDLAQAFDALYQITETIYCKGSDLSDTILTLKQKYTTQE